MFERHNHVFLIITVILQITVVQMWAEVTSEKALCTIIEQRTSENQKGRERDSKRGRRLNATEEAITESFSHTVLWPRSANKMKQENYTLAEGLGSLL